MDLAARYTLKDSLLEENNGMARFALQGYFYSAYSENPRSELLPRGNTGYASGNG